MDALFRARLFDTDGYPVSAVPFGNGHINSTVLITTDTNHRYVLQKINGNVFKDPEGLMNNIAAVTDHLRRKDPDPRHVLTLVPAKDGMLWHTDENGDVIRLTEYITDSICMDMPETPDDFELIGSAFGRFQLLLADFPANQLAETIPHFHDTPDRYRQLEEAIEKNAAGRLDEVSEEVAFFRARKKDTSFVTDLLAAGKLPLRVTHNDTKTNNIMLDKDTKQPLCVLDLDTVMPGLAGNDFGEAVRTGASTGAEDEQDLDKVSLSLEMYEAFARGFLSVCGSSLTETEKETLAMCARLMTMENGMRFLADYLNGDVYFAIHRPGHNLDRCRSQMKLLTDMESKYAAMTEIIRHL
ncbi:MAG: aminoglycoside phosphotransferase family protein [Clostridia bacterium]|nr:aminoglycoside phosphotransferase family protein [Clostridia bacterium]